MRPLKPIMLGALLWLTGTALHAQNIPSSVNIVPPATAVPIPAAYTNTKINYVRMWEPVLKSTDTGIIKSTGRTVAEVKQSSRYFDGLGRLIQTVVKGNSATQKDVVHPVIYDAFGREQYKYLPYIPQAGNTSDGKFKVDPFNAQRAYYQNSNLNPGVSEETIYYQQTEFETSPLDRVLNTFAPGNSWAKEGGAHPIKAQYQVNTIADSVRLWSINAIIPVNTNNGVYSPGTLYKNVIINEAGNQVIEYKDMDGRVVLKKQQAVEDYGTAHMGWLCTYYVYDDLGNLRFVLPPKAVEAIVGDWNIPTNIASELCFIYRYDDRNRMIVKKIPGADSTEMVYDIRDRLVFTRDGNLKEQHQWKVTFYDGLDRPTMAALYNAATSRTDLQNVMNTAVDTRSISYTFPGPADLVLSDYDYLSLYQASNSIIFQNGFDTGEGAELVAEIDPAVNRGTDIIVAVNPLPGIPESALVPLVYTFYDDYNYAGKLPYETGDIKEPKAGNNQYAEELPVVPSNQTKGLVTGSKVRILETGQWLTTSTYYDERGRTIQQVADNHKNGKETITTLYDFNGKILSTFLRHKNPASSTTLVTTILTMLQYDPAGRLVSIKKRVNDKPDWERVISENNYDELGQLVQKRLGVTGNGAQLDAISYEYNIHGWLKGINKAFVNDAAAANWFGQELNYDNGFTNVQFNGNIAGIKWKSKSDGIARAYGYGYDKVNRLNSADFTQQNTIAAAWTRDQKDFSVSNLTYDANGNIGSMTQEGILNNTPATIDRLTYNYAKNSNKLIAVTDPVNTVGAQLGDFTNGTNTGNDYSYDSNGNLKEDLNKGITSINYNYLNLPENIVVNGKGTITYQYDATGAKLKKTVTDNTGTQPRITVTDYIGGFVYQQDSLQFLAHEEGRIRPLFKEGHPVSFVYDYFEKDHLGNVRIVLTEQTDFSMYAATMEKEAAAKETTLFSNITETRTPKPVGYPEDNTTVQNAFVAKLNAKAGENKIGPSLVLRVMAGDTVQIGAKAFYKSQGPKESKQSAPVSEMVAELAQAFNMSQGQGGVHGDVSQNSRSPFTVDFYNNNYQRLKQKDPDQHRPDKPKAYLNFVLFDDQFNLVDANSGVKQVQGQPDELQLLAVDKMPIAKSGFLYVYTSNETEQDVYFDDIVLGLSNGPMLEETHYYPFGLTMAGISSNALKGSNYAENRKKYNGIEYTNELDLDIYDAQLRNLDPQIGRWNQIDPKIENMEMWSPYASNYNNPIRYNDFLGDSGTVPLIVPRTVNNDGDQKGLITNATADYYKQNPIGAFNRDFSHAVLSLIGINALDDYIANRMDSKNNSVAQVAVETMSLGIALSRGEGGGMPEKVPLPDNATVVRGGVNTPESVAKGIGNHPEGVTGVSVECGTCSVEQLAQNIPHNQVGVTTVGEVRAAGGDVIKTSGKSPNHATLTNLTPQAISELLNPPIKNPAKKTQ
ncbi:DUF6443 domain-containing protein [Chitinophaga sp. 30R24]|uniref:DUF6443 domain-containing protein n=1 Tax=Chitinophaga sp. 30R24 TaxID=3248838 RepID=UPI003B90B295